MQSKKKRAALSALLIAGIMLVGSACGSSSSNSGASSTTSAKSSGGNGSDASACADLFNKSEELAAKLDALDTGEMSAGVSSMVKSLESFSSSVPSEIREDWKTIVATIKTYAEAIAGIDFNNLADPDTVAKLDKAGSAMDDAKFEKASENLDQWTQKNCPGFDF
jgi:hypothetical protein